MTDGFASRSAGLSFVPQEHFRDDLVADEELAGPAFQSMFSDPHYFDSFHCRWCKLYVIDYSTVLGADQVRELMRRRELVRILSEVQEEIHEGSATYADEVAATAIDRLVSLLENRLSGESDAERKPEQAHSGN